MADYIYAGTRAKALQDELLSETQRELLLGSKSVDDFFTNLHDTFLARYVADKRERSISQILEDTIIDTKKLLVSIAPEQAVLDVLWLKYDFYNIKAMIKGDLAGLSDDDIKKHCFTIGLYHMERLLQAYKNNNLASIDNRIKRAVDEARDKKTPAEIDLVLNFHYLNSARDASLETGDDFIREYISLLIDIFNIRTSLRIKAADQENIFPPDIFVEGGSFYKESLSSTDDTLALLDRFGTEDRLKDAINDFRRSGSFSLIEKFIDDYVAGWLMNKSREINSSAPLISFFTAKKNNAQFIRAVYVGKSSGLNESDLRRWLRNPYTNL